MNKQQGFTLIELIVVIIILGILAAYAVPKFLDLSGDASTAASNMTTNSAAEHAKDSAACTAMSAKLPNSNCNP